MKVLPGEPVCMFDRFIVGVDGSETARVAARTAFDLARVFDAPVDLVNVLERSLLDALRSEEDRERIREERTDRLATLAAEARDLGLRTTTTVLDGKPASRLATYADQRPGSVVVLGRQGRSAVSKRLLGGVTERVLGAGTTPVLVVPGGDGTPDAAAGPVLIPTDGSENATDAYPYAASLASTLDTPIHLLSILDLQRAGGVFNAGGLERDLIDRLESELDEVLAEGRDELAASAPDCTIDTERRRTAAFEGVSGQIRESATDIDARWIVMGSHGRSNVHRQLVGSVTETLLRDVTIPVLIVPRGGDQSSAG